MADKIIKIHQTNKEKFIDEVLEVMEENAIEQIMIACKMPTGEIFTGYCSLNMVEKQELIGHLQIDIINDMIKANYITP